MIIEIEDMRLFRAAFAAKAKKDVRPYLNGLLFSAQGVVVGTDGDILVKTKCSDYEGENVILNFDRSPPANADKLKINLDSETCAFYKTGVEICLCRVTVIQGSYPDYNRIFPSSPVEANQELSVNTDLLAKIQKAAKLPGFVIFGAPDITSPVLFFAHQYTKEQFSGLIAQLRYKGVGNG